MRENIKMYRRDEIVDRTGNSSTQIHRQIHAGLFPPPVKLGERVAAWPSYEADAILAARIAGHSDEQIRSLVQRLIAERRQAA